MQTINNSGWNEGSNKSTQNDENAWSDSKNYYDDENKLKFEIS